jgi:hypothetical protein
MNLPADTSELPHRVVHPPTLSIYSGSSFAHHGANWIAELDIEGVGCRWTIFVGDYLGFAERDRLCVTNPFFHAGGTVDRPMNSKLLTALGVFSILKPPAPGSVAPAD